MTPEQRQVIVKTALTTGLTAVVVGMVACALPLALMQALWHYIPRSGVSPVGFFGAIWIWGALRKPGGITSLGFMNVALPYMAVTTIAMMMLADRLGVFAGTVVGSGLALGVAGAIAGYVTARRSVEQPEAGGPATGA